MINEIKAQMKNDKMNERVLTENGALGYKTTGKELVDFFFKVSSYRKAPASVICKEFVEMYNEDPENALRLLFYVRDVREGLGERRLFRVILSYIANKEVGGITINVNTLCQKIMELGRADDMLLLLDTDYKEEVLKFISATLKQDVSAMKLEEPISLMAKWLPSINTTSKASVEVAKVICKGIGMSEKEYRKTLASLRKYLNVVEVKMTGNEWGTIDYNSVTSKANLNYKNAFMRHDEERRSVYLSKLERGDSSVRINSKTVYPCDITSKYRLDRNLKNYKDITLEEMWKALPDKVKGNSNTLVVADGSGSMYRPVNSGSSVTAWDVASSLAIYFAERAKGEFKDTFITFSENPQLVQIKGDTLLNKLKIVHNHHEIANTNIEAVFDLILRTAVNSHMKQEDLPSNILILSDMEFDTCAVKGSVHQGTYSSYSRNRIGEDTTLFEELRHRYEEQGYQLPRLIFWNICSTSGAIPVRENKAGVALVSGFSPNVLDMVMSNELDPYKCITKILMNKRYNVDSFTFTA